MTVGNLVMILNKNLPRNEWLTGVVSEVKTSRDDLVRSVLVRIKGAGGVSKVVTRCIHDLVLLCPSPDHKC